MSEEAKPQIPEGASEEEKKALRHSGGHGGDGGRGTPGDYDLPKHSPVKPDKGYTGHRK